MRGLGRRKAVPHCSRIATALPGWLVLTLAMASSAVLAGVPEIPAQDDMSVNVVSDHMVFNGLEMATYELRSARSVDEVADFYKTAWHGQMAATDVQVGLDHMPWKVLSHREDEYLITVQLQPGDKSGRGSYGLVAVSKAFDGKRHEANRDFPMPADSRVVSDVATTDLGKRSRTLVLQNEDSVQYNLDFYRERLQKQGWAEVSKPTSLAPGMRPPQALMMSRDDDEINLAVDRSGGTSTVVIVTVDR